MALDRTALDHACNVIRRQVQGEFHDLTPLFVVYKPGEKDKAILRESGAIMSYPDGKAIMRIFKKAEKSGQTGFLGLLSGIHQGRLPFLKRKHLYGLFFIDAGRFKHLDVAKVNIYHLLWHAFDLREAFLSNEASSFTLHDHLVTPQDAEAHKAEKNLIADVFAALLMEMQEKNNSNIRRIAAWRAINTLKPVPNYDAEHYPYPVALETTQLVYDDLKDSMDPRSGPYSRAVQLAKEVGMTHDAQSIRQWQAFSFAAQEMAWSGCTPEQILSAAIFASEDPYVKATAYLVSEAINLKPQSLANIDVYNPYAEPETNERFHRKLCETTLQNVLTQALPMYDSSLFLKEAHRQIENLMQGNILGWCAHALIGAARVFGDSGHEDVVIPTTLAFWESYNRTPWKSLQALSIDIMRLKRSGIKISRIDMEAMLERHPDLAHVRECFSAADMEALEALAQDQTPKIVIPALEKRASQDIGATDFDFDFFSPSDKTH